jgi:hypothetical protein
MIEIEPCPKCGQMAIYHQLRRQVRCVVITCGSEGQRNLPRGRAIREWNRVARAARCEVVSKKGGA